MGLTLQILKTIWLYKCSPFELFSKKGSIKSHQCLLYLAHGRYRWKSLRKRQDKVSNPLIVWDTIIMFNDMDSINMFPSSADYVFFFFNNYIYQNKIIQYNNKLNYQYCTIQQLYIVSSVLFYFYSYNFRLFYDNFWR